MISTGYKIPYILKTTESFPFPLDDIDPSEFVYGGAFFQLRSDYTGAAIRIRRASDDAETDISCNLEITPGQVIVDPSEISSFGSDCYLTKIYDQVGSGINWSQTTKSLQPAVCQSGTVVTNVKGIVGAYSIGGDSLTTDNITYPKDFLEMSGYSESSGVAITGRGGTYMLSTANGFFNLAYENTINEILCRIYNSGGGALSTFSNFDVPTPTNGVHNSLYCDDTNGVGFSRTQSLQSSNFNWTANSRTAATTNKIYFGISLTGHVTQHYSILFNNSSDKATYEQRIFNLMGM